MSDILIVGGGIIGLLTARELALSGAKVRLLEKQKIGQESSWAGGGILSPLYPWRYADPVSALAQWGQNSYLKLIDEIKEKTSLDPELEHSGLLILDSAESDKAISWAKKWQQNLELIDHEEAQNIEPATELLNTAADNNHIWMPDVGQVRNPRFVKALQKYVEQQGVVLQEQVKVNDFIIKENKVCGVKTSVGEILADQVIVAGGAWSAELLKKVNVSISIEPVKGQMILFKAKPAEIKRIVLSQDRYVIPRRDGRVLVGSTLEHSGFDKSTTEQARDELYKEAIRIIPALKDAIIEHHWAGLRPSSPNGLPYICEHAELSGLYINSGHFRNGVVLGPASARLMADIILKRAPILDKSDYQFLPAAFK
ncbi:MAG: glycine oxidase ThiO [Gammaproteobacteria bacterium]|nr:glycine oxidase ThiO [Gammaproteobacteria bacterium]